MLRVVIRFAVMPLLLAAAPGLAANPPPKEPSSAEMSRGLAREVAGLGYSVTRDTKAKPAAVTVKLSQSEYLGHLGQLRQLHMINPKLPDDYVLSHIYSTGFSLLVDYMPIAINETFAPPGGAKTVPEHAHFSGVLTYPDGKGGETSEEVVSFDFDRALFKRIDWSKFPPYNLMSTAPHFTIAPSIKQKMTEEAQP